jgi:hypothetical protein
MSVIIESCDSYAQLEVFTQFPYDLYRSNNYWIPPLKKQELYSLQRDRNPALKNIHCNFWIVYKDGKVAGRTGAVINPEYNKKTGKSLCRLTRTEFIDDFEVSSALFNTAEKWAQENGMDGVNGPLGFTNLDHQAILIEGFDQLPSIASEYHLPYYKDHFEKAGYEKEMDWIEFRLSLGESIPEKAVKLSELILKRYNLNVIHFKSKQEIKNIAPRIFELLNKSFNDLFSFINMEEDIASYYTDKYFDLIDPEFIKVIEDKEKNLVGFIISLPSLSLAMKKANGRLFPFGWYHISKALKKPTVVDLLLTAIHPDWQAQGISAILITELQKIMIKHRVKFVETTGIIETNDKAINHWKNYEHLQHKRKRCFIKNF